MERIGCGRLSSVFVGLLGRLGYIRWTVLGLRRVRYLTAPAVARMNR